GHRAPWADRIVAAPRHPNPLSGRCGRGERRHLPFAARAPGRLLPDKFRSLPVSIQASEHYTGQRGAEYAATRHKSHQSVGYDLNFDTFRPHINAGDRVLDFGCGNGGMLPRIQSHGAEPEGLEVNPAAGAIAREAGFTVYPALDEIPADRQYDVIVSNH